MPPSSMTKLMTIYIVYRAAEAGPHETRPTVAGEREGLADGRIEDVRADRHARFRWRT